MDKKYRLPPRLAGFIVLIVFILGCSPATNPPAEITQGSSKNDALALYGEPVRIQEFIIPDEPFFGPQEGLVHLVPPGTTIEEWVYELGDEELYIWFTGENDEERGNWLILDLGRYPKGAVH